MKSSYRLPLVYFFIAISIASASAQNTIVQQPINQSKSAGFDTKDYEAWLYTRVKNQSIQRLPFRLLKPVNYNQSANKLYPLVIMLHGRGEAGTENNFHLKWGGKDHLEARNNAANPAYTKTNKLDGFVMYPQEPYGQWTNHPSFDWPGGQLTSALEQVHDVIDSLVKKYKIDPDRIVIHGLSSGGTGTWASLYHRPDLFAAALPMSTPGDLTQMGKIVTIPIWLFQGGTDTNPIPYISQQVIKALRDSGAVDTDVTRYTEYPTVGHDTWGKAYIDPDFFPYILRYSKRRIMTLARNPFCPGESTSLGVSPGFYDYQWYRDNTIIAGETTNKIKHITTPGKYFVKFRRSAGALVYTFSDTVNVIQDVLPAKPTLEADQSLILPSPSASSVTLKGPAGYEFYQWSTNATTPNITTNMSGSYTLKVRAANGCWSFPSDTAYVRVGNNVGVISMPTNLKAFPTSPVSANVTWQDNSSNETGFEIYRANQSSGPYSFVKLVAANTQAYEDISATPASKLYYKVRAVNKVTATLSSEYAYTETFKDLVAPSIPQNLKIASINPEGMLLRWNRSSDLYAVKYIFYSGNSVAGTTTDTTFLFPELTPGEIYSFSVEAQDLSGNKSGKGNTVFYQYLGRGLFGSFYSGAWDKLPDFNSLTPVKRDLFANPHLSSGTKSNILGTNFFQLDGDNYAVSYRGFVNISNPGTYTFYVVSDDGSKLNFADQVIDNDGTHGEVEKSKSKNFAQSGWYPFRVDMFEKGSGQALKVYYERSGGNPSKVLIPDNNFAPSGGSTGNSPTSPSNPTVSNLQPLGLSQLVTNGKIRIKATISFTSTPNANVKGFELYRVQSNTEPSVASNPKWEKIATIPRTNNALSRDYIDSLHAPGVFIKPSTKYYYYLRILSETGSEVKHYSFDYKFLTTTNPSFGTVSAPTVLQGQAISNTVVRLTFTDNSTNESGFEILRSQDPVNYFNVIGNAPPNATSSVTFYDSTGVVNTTYYYKARGFNSTGVSAFSNVLTLGTLNMPTAPSNLTAEVVGPKHVNLTWQNNSTSNGFGFKVYRSTDSLTAYVQIANIPNPGLAAYQDTSVALTQKFYYKVQAYNNDPSLFSNIVSARTFLPVTPSPLDWKMPVTEVGTNLKVYAGATYTRYNNNIPFIAQSLENKKDFLKYAFIEKNDSAYVEFKLPASMPHGGLVTFNVMAARIKAGATIPYPSDSTEVLDALFSDVHAGYRYTVKLFVSNDKVTWTLAPNQPWLFTYSNMLQKVDLAANLAGKYVRIYIKSICPESIANYGGLFLSEIGAYRFLGPNVRHNYFVMVGASVERTFLPLGMNQFRKRLVNSGLPGGDQALIFNLSYPGRASKYVADSLSNILSRHPYSNYVIIHQGGNDINYSGNGMRPLSYAGYRNLSGVKNFINNFTSIIKTIQNSGKVPFVSRMHFRDYKTYCPNTTRLPNQVFNDNAPGVFKGRNQENGSLPFNLIIDSLTKAMTPFAYNYDEKRSSINYYPITLNRQVMLGPDGVHPVSVTQRFVDVMADYWIDYVFRYVYTGKFAAPIDYNPDNQIEAHTDTSCASLQPANKPNLYTLAVAAVVQAEKTKSGSDVWDARILVEQLGSKNIRIPLVNRLDSLTDYRSPANPTSLTANVVDGATVSLSWLDNDIIETGYQVWKSNNGTIYKLVTTVPANISQHNVSGLSGDTLYHFYVRAINNKFESGWSNIATARPGATYFSSETGDIANTITWGRNPDGTGTRPTSFSTSSQVYVFANRPAESVLATTWNVGGSFSKVILSPGTKLRVETTGALSGKIEMMSQSQLTIKSTTIPEFLSIDTTSSITFANTANVANTLFGNLALTTTGTKYFTQDTVEIKGNLTLGQAILVKGKPTVIKLHGNITYSDNLPTLEDVTIILKKNAHNIDAKGGSLDLHSLHIPDAAYITLLNGSKLKLGSSIGGGLDMGHNTVLDIKNGELHIVGKGALNSADKQARISSTLGSLHLNTTTAEHSYLYPSSTNCTFRDITHYNGVGSTLWIKDSLELINTLKLGRGTLHTGDHIVLVSNKFNTARIAKVENQASLLGQVKWQRLIGPFKSQAYYLLGIPIMDKKIIELKNYINLKGFKATEAATAAYWNEPTNKWIGVRDSTNFLNPGRGYRVYLDDTDIKYMDESAFIELKGEPVIGNGQGSSGGSFSIPLSNSNGGWNVVSNPYPCEIDWNAPTGWDKSFVTDCFYIWDGKRKSYKVYCSPTSSTPEATTAGMTSIINAGQGFLVKATSSENGGLSLNEDVKKSDAVQPPFYRIQKPEQIRVNLRNEKYESDEVLIRFSEGSSAAYDKMYDALKYNGTGLNLSTIATGNDRLTINSLPYANKQMTIPLHVQAGIKGTYNLDFTDIESFDPSVKIYLQDIEADTLVDLRKTFTYPFTTASLIDSKTRFSILFDNLPTDRILAYEEEQNLVQMVSAYPNPARDNTTFKVLLKKEAQVELAVFNSNGQEVYQSSIHGHAGENAVNWKIEEQLAPGMYCYKIKVEGQPYSGKIVIE